MKAAPLWLLWVATLVAAFAAGRLWVGAEEPPLDSVASFEAALATRDELERAHRMSAFFRALGPEDLPAALAALEARNVGFTREEVRLLMLAWTRFDAPAALAWARAWPTEWNTTLSSEAFYAWAFRDAPAALRELEALEEGELKARLRRSLLEGWLHGPDVAGASEYIAAVPEPRQRSRLAFLLAAETMRDGSDAVMRWAEGVPEDAPNDFKRGAFYHAASLAAREDARRTAEWFAAHRARPYSAGSLEVIAQRWAEYHDPPALFEWLGSLPSAGGREGETGEAVAAGFLAWLRRSPEEAEAWLETSLPDPRLDPAVVALARSRFQTSPASAVEWAQRIEDESQRRAQTVVGFRSWKRRDPQAAAAWLERSELAPDLREAIERSAPPAKAGPRAAARP